MKPGTGTPRIIVLPFTALGRYCVFINIQARPSTSKKIMTHRRLR